MATASDTFTRGNENPLAGNWTCYAGTFILTSNHVEALSGAADAYAYWNANTFVDDQFSEAAIAINGGTGSGQGLGFVLRSNGLTDKATYRVVVDHNATNNVEIARFNPNGGTGAYTSLKLVNQAWTDGDVWRAEIVGYVITVKRNGSIVTTFDDSASGSKIASGKLGLANSSNTATPMSIDNWNGGDIPPSVPNSVGPLTGTASTIMPGGPGWRGN